MKTKTITIAIMAALMIAGCGKKATESKEAAAGDIEEEQMAVDEKASDENTTVKTEFDITKYQDVLFEYAFPARYMKSTDPVRLVEYALVDIDGDGQDELWVRSDDGQDYQGVFAIVGDSLELLADADVRSEIKMYDGAVCYEGYYGDGRVWNGGSVVRNSRRAEYYEEEYTFNSFSEDQEMLEESYDVNGKSATAEECSKFCEQLGDTISTASLVWHKIEPPICREL